MLQNKNSQVRTLIVSSLMLGAWLTSHTAIAAINTPTAVVEAKAYPPTTMDPLLIPALQAPLAAKSLLADIAMVGTRVVAVGEHGNIVYSDDAGVHWQQAKVPVSINLTAVTFVDQKQGWAVGHHGAILKSEDAGASWTLNFDGMDAGVQVIAAAQAEYDAAEEALQNASNENEENAALEHFDMADVALSDARASIEFGPAQPLMDIWFEDAKRGMAIGSYGQIFRTLDGGENWALWKHGIDNPNNFHYYDISESANGNLYLVGEQGMLHVSRDRGESWTPLQSPYQGSLYGVLNAPHADGEVLLVYGFNGNAFRSLDQGQSWSKVNIPTRKSLNDGVVLEDGSILLVGNSGVLLHSKDAGATFTIQTDQLERPFISAAALGPDKLALVGIAGVRIIQLGEGAAL